MFSSNGWTTEHEKSWNEEDPMTNEADLKWFDMALNKFIQEAQALVDERWQRDGYADAPHMQILKATIAIDNPNSKRYIRIVKQEIRGNRSVYCFIDKTNGDVLKGSWKAPVKNGVRGNIFKGQAADYMDWHGPKYLR